MAEPIEIAFASDVRDVIKGTDSIADAFDDVSDSLRDLERDSDDATDKLADGAGDAAKDVGRLEDSIRDAVDEADKLSKEGGDAFDKLSSGARDSSKKIGDDTTAGFDRAKQGADEFKDEANSTAKEAAASFDGSAESIGDVFQELSANAFAGFGPAGAAAGLAAAVGIGIAIGKLQELAETNTEAKEKMAELGREIYDTGGAMSDADLAGKVADIAFSLAEEDVWYKWGDQAITHTGLVKEALEGVDDAIAKDSFQALAGDVDAAARAQDGLKESIEADTRALEDHVLLVDEYGNTVLTKEGEAIQASIDKRKDLQDKIADVTGVQQDANAEVDYYTQIMGESTEAIEAANESLEAHADALDKATGRAMDADQAELDYAAQLQESSDAIIENGKQTDINTEAGRNNRGALLDLAKAALGNQEAMIANGDATADVKAKTDAARSAFIEAAESAGYTKAEAKKLADQYGLIPANVDTHVKAHNVQQTKNELDGLAEPRTATITPLLGSTNDVDNWFQGKVGGLRIPVDFYTRKGVSAAP